MTVPGRWHWAKNAATRLPPEMSVCCCSDDKHNFREVTPEYLDALEAERDEAVKHCELLHASFDSLMAERDALREQLADALTDLGWSPDKVQIALDAAQKEER